MPGISRYILSMFDPVKKPLHYNSHPSGVECITITQHMTFCIGNVVKYCWRSGLKGRQVEDLKKARFYLNCEINRLEALQKQSPGNEAPTASPSPAAA